MKKCMAYLLVLTAILCGCASPAQITDAEGNPITIEEAQEIINAAASPQMADVTKGTELSADVARDVVSKETNSQTLQANEYKPFVAENLEANSGEQLLFEDPFGLRVYYTGYAPDGVFHDFQVTTRIENKSDQEVDVAFFDLAANDMMTTGGRGTDVPSGKTDLLDLFFELEDYGLLADDVDKVEFTIDVKYASSSDRDYDSKPIVITGFETVDSNVASDSYDSMPINDESSQTVEDWNNIVEVFGDD